MNQKFLCTLFLVFSFNTAFAQSIEVPNNKLIEQQKTEPRVYLGDKSKLDEKEKAFQILISLVKDNSAIIGSSFFCNFKEDKIKLISDNLDATIKKYILSAEEYNFLKKIAEDTLWESRKNGPKIANLDCDSFLPEFDKIIDYLNQKPKS